MNKTNRVSLVLGGVYLGGAALFYAVLALMA